MWGWLKRLGKTRQDEAPAAMPLHYQGYEIIAAPVKAHGQYRLSGTIRPAEGNAGDAQPFERADTFPDRETAIRMMQLKARQFIDQQQGGLHDLHE